MKLSDFDYNLPKELIANSHCEPRDHSRLLVVDRSLGYARDKKFYEIIEFFEKGDILVFNNSKVFKARIYGKKKTGGKVEFLLIRPVGAVPCARPSSIWETLVKGKIKVGDKIYFGDKVEAEVLEKNERTLKVKFNISAEKMFEYLEKRGETPLPPYIHPVKSPANRGAKQFDGVNFYQTVYASKTGSVAAPTAGFHFTPELLDKLKKKGVECLEITLHVGLGTFLPVESENIIKHKMHEEFFEVKKEVWNKILDAKKSSQGGSSRIIAVGTTTCRTLESVFRDKKLVGSTDIFIYPPYDFKIVNGLITNFHLPKSTLLMLVSAFLDPKGERGILVVKDLYQKAVAEGYRVFSFGDVMLIV